MKKIYLTTSCILFVIASTFAQLAMTRSTYSAPYSPITLPTATLSAATGDDSAQSTIPIGFTFNYLGTNYTSIGVNTNGVASFGAVMSNTGANTNLYTATVPQTSLAPWWDDLWSDTVLYQLQGIPGSQTFTIQWTNSLSYYTTATQRLNFQIILHETTNVIEFAYGNVVAGTMNNLESASIGIEGATGGNGNYLDAVTGSAFTSNGMNRASTKWPDHNYRFTPGAPTPIAGGNYTVGVAGNYFSLSEAIADINHRGISGAVTLSLIDANYDAAPANGHNIFPMLLGPVAGSSSTNTISILPVSGTAHLDYDGMLAGNCGNQASTNSISTTNEPMLGIVGGNYISVSNLNFNCAPNGVVDRGIAVLNSSATVGSQNNIFTGITVNLSRTNASSIGIEQRAATNPTNATGANSNNGYFNLNISNVYSGIFLSGNANFPDMNCQIGNSSPTNFNMIGSAIPNDIGNGATPTYGIRATSQNGVSIFNNEVQNVTQTGNSSADGIALELSQGTCSVYMNKIHDINCSSATGTGNISGIRANVANAGTQNARVYDNFVFNINSAFTGVATATRYVKGIWAQSLGGGAATSSIDVDFNNVRMDNSGSPNCSGTCFESGTVTGPIINVRSNVFANFTGAQAGNANHLDMASANATAIGNAGSVSNYNDLFVNNSTNGFTGRGNTTNYSTLANWQTAMTQDANSIAVDPGFNSATDLHVSAIGLNNSGITGIAWVTVDIDNQARSVTPDIGADEFTPLLIDAGVTALDSPATSGCHSANETVMVTLKNFATVPLDFTSNNTTVTVHVTGTIVQALNFTLTNNSLNGNVPLASGMSMMVPVGTINMSAQGNYNFKSYSTLAGDGNAANDTMANVHIIYIPGIALANPTSICAGSSVDLTLNNFSPGGTIQWQSSIDGGVTWVNEIGVGATTPNYTTTPTDTTLYQSQFCGMLLSNVDTVLYFNTTSATTVNDTICGPGTGTMTAMGTGTFNWYANAVGGNSLATGSTYSAAVGNTTTFYVSSTNGSVAQHVGLFDNSAGGGQSASANNLIFNVMQNCTLDGVYIYPGSVGNAIVNLNDSTGATINSDTIIIIPAEVGQRVYVPLNFSLVTGNNYALVRPNASVTLWRNTVGVNYPYQIPGIISITGSTSGPANYYYYYDWKVSYGCEGTRTPAEIVVTSPTAISVASSSLSLCAGDSTMLTASSTDLNYTYAWSPATGLNTTSGASVMATPAMTTQYIVTGSDASSGCNATDTVNVVVHILPTFTLSVADTMICSGAMDTIVAFPAMHVGLQNDTAGGGQSAAVQNLIFNVLSNCTLAGVYIYPGAAGNVTIDLEDNTNAVINAANFTVTAAQVNQRVWVPLNFNLTPATGMQLVRNATSVNLFRNNAGVNYPYTIPNVISITGSTAGAGYYYYFYDWLIRTAGPYHYSWTSLPTGFTSNSDSAFVSPTVNTQYILTVTDTTAGCVAIYNTTVNIFPPVSAMISGITSVCQGDSTILIASATGGNGNVSYLWSNSLGTNDSVMVTPTSTATYSVTATDGCGTTSTSTATVSVNSAPPIANFTYAATGVNTFTFTDASTNATSWLWNFGDTQTSTLQSPTHVYASTGMDTVTLIVMNGCGADTFMALINVNGIENYPFGNSVNIYPNPANGQFAVNFSDVNSSFVKIELFTMQGKLMQAKQVSNPKAGTSVPVNVEGYPVGMYMLKLTGENGSQTFKIVVQ